MCEFKCAARQSQPVCNRIGVITNIGNDERNDVGLTHIACDGAVCAAFSWLNFNAAIRDSFGGMSGLWQRHGDRHPRFISSLSL